jgi:peptidoglycan lytic transglycosylase
VDPDFDRPSRRVQFASGGALPHDQKGFSGLASVYSKTYSGRTADGETYDPKKFTCAHPNLPFGTRLRVTRNGRGVTVVVNDRGPFIRGRVLDLSLAAGRALGITGVSKVTATAQ